MPKKKSTKKKAPKKIVIRLRIIPLAELKLRLGAAQVATAKFETDLKDLKWSSEDATEHRRLIGVESDAGDLVTDHAMHRGKAKR